MITLSQKPEKLLSVKINKMNISVFAINAITLKKQL